VDIGFPPNCLDATVPTCAGVVDTLQKLVDCVDCVTEFNVDCADRAAVPAFAAYPAECNPTPTITPTPTVTPTP
jgi:hypothetical protein